MTARRWMGVLVGAALLSIAQIAGADDPAPATTQAAPAPAATDSAATGTVIFFRPKKLMGMAVGFKVREGETVLGKLRNGTYFILHPTAGAHQYVVHSESKDKLEMEVEAGETYYVQGTLGMGVMVGRPNLSPSDAATFEAIKAKLKDVTGQAAGDDKD